MGQGLRVSSFATAEVICQIVRLTSGPSFVGGLNPAQWAALRYFGRVGLSACSVTAFARYHGTSKGTASQTIAALTRKGLVERLQNPDDRRLVHFVLTETGRTALENDPIQLVAQAVGALSADEQGRLAELLEKIVRSVLAQRAASGVAEELAEDGADDDDL
jgi:DNA-binding MarR family transcriptional regulator